MEAAQASIAEHRCADRRAAGADRAKPGAGGAAQAALTFAQQQAARYQHLAQNGCGHRAERPAVHLAAASAAGCAAERAGGAEARAAARVEVAEGAAQQRRGEPRAGERPARPGEAQSLLHDRHRRAAGTRRATLGAAVGQYAQPGTSLAMFVPDDIWVTANFKETQLDHMRPGRAGDAAYRRLSGTHDPTAMSRACSPAPAPRSRCCRPRTPPATTSRSCSACR